MSRRILGPDGRAYDPDAPVILPPAQVAVAGLVGYRIFNKFSGKTRIEVPLYPNLITDFGLDEWGANNSWFLQGVKVGSGNTPPSAGQSSLDAYLGVSDSVGPESTNSGSTQDANLDWYGFYRAVWRLEAGTGTGSIAELGYTTDRASGDGTACFSRELVRDALGDPTTINKDTDEILDVTWEIRAYQNPNDVIVNALPIGAGTHDVTIRPANIDTYQDMAVNYPAGMYPRGNIVNTYRFSAMEGPIGAIDESPAGWSSQIGGNSSTSFSSYSPSSYFIDVSHFWNVDKGNYAGGIGAVQYGTNFGWWQLGFDPKIPKTSDFELTLNHRLTWARKNNIP